MLWVALGGIGLVGVLSILDAVNTYRWARKVARNDVGAPVDARQTLQAEMDALWLRHCFLRDGMTVRELLTRASEDEVGLTIEDMDLALSMIRDVAVVNGVVRFRADLRHGRILNALIGAAPIGLLAVEIIRRVGHLDEDGDEEDGLEGSEEEACWDWGRFSHVLRLPFPIA
jgi:hypothetical protein